MTSKKPSFPISWKPKVKAPDGDSYDESLLSTAVKDEPKGIFGVWAMVEHNCKRKRSKYTGDKAMYMV